MGGVNADDEWVIIIIICCGSAGGVKESLTRKLTLFGGYEVGIYNGIIEFNGRNESSEVVINSEQ